MKFKIIANEQTPIIGETKSVQELLTDFKLLEKFLSFARRQHNCIGLAANQVSLDGNRIMENFFAIKTDHTWDIILHPEIIQYIGKPEKQTEGCLTWLGKKIIADRFPEIQVVYYNLKGEKKSETISGFEAQIWQHEYNHLHGIPELIE